MDLVGMPWAVVPVVEPQLPPDDHLRSTGLDWTILGPSRLMDNPGTGWIPFGR